MSIFNIKWLIIAVGFTAVVLVFSHLFPPFPSQTASLTDWLADIVGISGVLLFFLRFKRPGYQSTLTTQHPTPET